MYHFNLKDCNFQCRLNLAMTINKSQGQSFSVWGIKLENLCFSPGQLCVTCPHIGKPSALWRWSDKYIAYKRKINILEKWWFISQHSLLSARYTWPSVAPASLTHLKNMFSRGLQSKPPHSTQISARWVTFSSLETKKITWGQIWRIRWMGQQFFVQFDQFGHGVGRGVSRCVVMVKEHFFYCQMGPFFLQFSVKSAQ